MTTKGDIATGKQEDKELQERLTNFQQHFQHKGVCQSMCSIVWQMMCKGYLGLSTSKVPRQLTAI